MNTGAIGPRAIYERSSLQERHSAFNQCAAAAALPPQQTDDTVATGREKRALTHEKKWTILFYGAGDNDLAQAMLQEVKQLESVGSSSAINIVAQLDLPDEDKGCCKTYFMKKGTDPEGISSPVVRELGSVNMADPGVLSDFIAFGIKNYPAAHYMLVIADHGKGWRGAISDMSHNGWMTPPQVRESIERGLDGKRKSLDIVAFDACLMASTEVAYELKDVAQYIVASEETEGRAGWSFPLILDGQPDENASGSIDSSLYKPFSPDSPAADLASRIVDCAKANPGRLYTMSAINLSRIEDLGNTVDRFARQILDTQTPGSTLRGIIRNTQGVGDRSLRDLRHFAQLVSSSPQISDEKLKEAAQKVTGSIDGAVMNVTGSNHAGSHDNAHGLNIELPIVNMNAAGYGDLAFGSHTLWQEALKKMLQ
jgi:hypothetical protein